MPGLDVLMPLFSVDAGQLAALGWALLVWLLGGGFGLAIVVFILLKLFGG